MKFLVFQLLILGALTSGQASAPQDADIKALFEKAQRALSAKDYPKAEEGFREVLKLNPSFTAAYVDLGVVYMRTKHFEAAVKSFERAKKLAPQEVGIDLNLGLAFYHELAFPKAIPSFSRVLQSLPDSFQARYLLGMSYFMTDNYQHTVATLEPLRDQSKDQPPVPFHRDALSLRGLGALRGETTRTSEKNNHRAGFGTIGSDRNRWRGVQFHDVLWRIKARVDPAAPGVVVYGKWRKLEVKRLPIGIQDRVQEHITV